MVPQIVFVVPLLGGLSLTGGLILGQHSATSTGPVDPVPTVTSPYFGCDDCTQQAMQIAWSMDHQADQWSSDGFVANRRGVYIWIANKDYGIRVGHNHHEAMGDFAWKPGANDQRLISAAYERWREAVALHASDINP